MTETCEPVRLAGSRLGRYCHVCAFFHSKDEFYDVLMPFIKEGIENGDRAFHIVDPQRRPEHLQRLGAGGVDVDAAERTGQLQVHPWQGAYLKDDRFDQHRMIADLMTALDSPERRPDQLIRAVGCMEWALEDYPGVHEILEYETRLNYALEGRRDPVVCTYDLSKFDANMVIDIMRTHPMVIVGGILQENPFYVPPDDMLRELQERAELAVA